MADPPGPPANSQQPDPSASPFRTPEVMTGYPLSPNEQETVDRVVEGATSDEDEDED